MYKYDDFFVIKKSILVEFESMYTSIRTIFVIALFCIYSLILNAQLVSTDITNPGVTANTLVQNDLVGGGIVVSNVTTNIGLGASPQQFARFTNGPAGSNLPFSTGVMLCTGYTSDFNNVGNNSTSFSSFNPNPPAGCFGGICGPSDPDLNAIVNPFPTFDAAVLEFDFIPLSDTVRFRYVFASEEYPEFACADYNDAFAFFLSGPGIVGAPNIATIPGSVPPLPVAINTVNPGVPGLSASIPHTCVAPNGSLAYSGYYVDNTISATLQFDGLTTILTAEAVVIPCSTYHIKLAVADAGDGSFDSAVFFEAGSFSSSALDIELDRNRPDSLIVEGCGEDVTVNISLASGIAPSDYDIPLNIFGTAQNGVDYLQIPDTVTILAGDSSVSFILSAIADALAEGTESIFIEIQRSACQQDTIEFFIVDGSAVNANAIVSSNYNGADISCNGVCDGETTVIGVGGITLLTGDYSYQWDAAAGSQTTSVVTGLCPGTYSVVVQDDNLCADTVSVTVTEPSAVTASITNVVNGSCSVPGQATASGIGGTAGYSFTWPASAGGQTTATATNLVTGTYQVTVSDVNNCSDTISVSVTTTNLISIVIDTVINTSCNGFADGAIDLSVIANPPYTYTWSSGQTVDDITGLTAGVYTVTAVDNLGCIGSQSVTVTEPTAVSVTLSEIPALCFGTNTGTAIAIGSGGTPTYTYLWDAGGQTSSSASNLAAAVYNVTVSDANSCTVSDAVTVTEPSQVSVTLTPTDIICNGATDGTIDASGLGGTSGYTYLWSDGQNGTPATGLAAGPYSVTATDANGCTTSGSTTITEPSIILLSPSVLSNYNGSDISCPGLADGSVGIVAAGGTGNFTYLWTPNGSTSDILTGLVAGTYDVTVTDGSGCSLDTSITINDPVQLQAVDTTLDVLCFGDNNGQIVLNAISGTGTLGLNGYEYKLTGPNQTGNVFSTVNVFNNLVAGNYIGYVRDGNNCEVQLSITINEPPQLLVDSVVISEVLCSGGSDGTATAYSSGGVGNYTYVWSDGQTGQTATGLSAGVYSVTVLDSNSCDRVEVFNMTEPTALASTITSTNVLCIGGVTTASVSATGGVPINVVGYQYQWDNGSTSNTAIGLGAGVHCVTVTDNNGCTTSSCVTVTEPASAVSVTISNQTDALCTGTATGTATALGAGGTSGYSYIWSDGQTSQTATGLLAGSYTVTVVDANGCTSQTSVTIGNPGIVTGQVTVQQNVSCYGGTDGILIGAGSGGVSNFSYVWSDGQTTSTATGLSAGTYSVTISDGNGCSVVSSSLVTEPTELDITNLVLTDVLCAGSSTGVAIASSIGGTPTNGYSYIWSGSSSTTETATGLGAGSYTVTVVDGNGCESDTSFVISEPSSYMSGYLNSTDALCSGQNSGQATAVISGGTSGYSYVWSDGQQSITADSLVSGSYTVTVTDGNGCTLTLSTTVGEASAVLVQAQEQQSVTCNGGSDGVAISNSASGGTGPYNYVWSDATGQTGQLASGLSAGVITVIATDANGCTASSSTTITEAAAISVNEVISAVSCYAGTDGSITITGSNTTIVNYSWSTGVFGNQIQNLGAGTYTLYVTNNVGCQDSFAYDLIEPTAVSLDIDQTGLIDCAGDGDGILEAGATGGTPGYNYAWSTGDNTSTITGLGPGIYSVTITDSKGCAQDTSYEVTEPEALLLSSEGSKLLCIGDANGTIVASASGGSQTVGLLEYSLDSISWQTGNIFAGLVVGDYTVYVRDERGCVKQVNEEVENADTFYITTITLDTTIEYLDSMELFVTLNDTVSVMYGWYDLSGGVTLLTDSSYRYMIAPSEATRYEFIAMNQYGCEVSQLVVVDVTKPRRANAATGFTPNGDGVNDNFYIQGGDKVEHVTMFRVYDRWGELVFEGTNMEVNNAQQGWDGTYRNKPCTSGTYLWYAEVLFKDGETKVLRGDVILLR